MPDVVKWFAPVIAFTVSAVGTFIVRKWALRSGLLDVPNERSAHDIPTPRGGGVAIVVASFLALVVAVWIWDLAADVFLAVMGGGLAVAAIGFLDDRKSIQPSIRLVVHVVSAIWALWWLGGMPSIQIGERIISAGWLGNFLGVIGIVWTINLFNFMDGIDGLAASETVFICLSGAILGVLFGFGIQVALIAAVIGAANLGFLIWNWPPAKIFMGDAGSGFGGYSVAVLTLAAASENTVAPYVWMLLGGVFFVDATVTLLRRLVQGERIYKAHRSHAYQLLARRWGGHLPVTALVMAINGAWLLPLAWLGAYRSEIAGWLVMIAMFPLVVVALVVGAGRAEVAQSIDAKSPP